jgi:hypothetical protein
MKKKARDVHPQALFTNNWLKTFDFRAKYESSWDGWGRCAIRGSEVSRYVS